MCSYWSLQVSNSLYWSLLVSSSLYWPPTVSTCSFWFLQVSNSLYWSLLEPTGSPTVYNGPYWSPTVSTCLCWCPTVCNGPYWAPTVSTGLDWCRRAGAGGLTGVQRDVGLLLVRLRADEQQVAGPGLQVIQRAGEDFFSFLLPLSLFAPSLSALPAFTPCAR